jgi:streptogramin lyase
MGSFNSESEEFKEYNTTSASSGPYAIGVDIYDNIGFSMTYAYKVGKFDHGTGTLHKYDLPTPRTLARFIYHDGDGNIWFPNNSNNKIAVIVQ